MSGTPRQGNYDDGAAIAAIIDDLGESGREAPTEELLRIRSYLASHALRRPSLTRDDELAGLRWQGRVLVPGDLLPRAEAKFLKHVVDRREWPDGTTVEMFMDSLERVVRNASGGVYLERDAGEWKLTFVARSGGWRGDGGGSHIVVVFIPTKGLWVTGYQPAGGLRQIERIGKLAGGRWLRRPD